MSFCSLVVQALRGESFCLDFRSSPNPENFRRYDFCILDIQSKPDLKEGHALGNEFYSYMSVGEIAGNAPYLAEVQARNLPLLQRNDRWDSYYVDQSDPGWATYVIKVLAKSVVDKGFDGFFLDTVDAVETLAEIDPSHAAAHRQGMINLIRGLKAAYPAKKIILNRGFAVFEDVKTDLKGVLVEELFQKDDYSVRSAGEVDELLRRISPITAAGLPIYIVDYVPEWNLDLAVRTAERISSLGFHPAVIPQHIDGTVLAPVPPPASSQPSLSPPAKPSPGVPPVMSLEPHQPIKASERDGTANGEGYLSGTDSQTQFSLLRVGLSKLDRQNIKLTFEASVGKSYTVEYCQSVQTTESWSKLQDVPPESTVRTIDLIDGFTNTVSHRFYRIVTPMRPSP